MIKKVLRVIPNCLNELQYVLPINNYVSEMVKNSCNERKLETKETWNERKAIWNIVTSLQFLFYVPNTVY